MMKSIVDEIIDWQTSELIARRNPTEIRLTDDQLRRLKEWCESIRTVSVAPDGSERISDPIPFSKDMVIFGMRVV